MVADDFARVRHAFVTAAERAVRIGFDTIELHMAHGYLLHSFMSPISNRREDDYGGTLENRVRFPREITEAVRQVVPRSIALGARFTGSDPTSIHHLPRDPEFLIELPQSVQILRLRHSHGDTGGDQR